MPSMKTSPKAEKSQKPTKLIVFNWKMNPTSLKEALSILEALKERVSKLKGVEIVLCPPIIFLSELLNAYQGKRISFGVQNGFYEDSGAWTGEVSFLQAYKEGADYAIINHSERKKLGESREIARKKLEAALRAHMRVVLCVGEEKRDHSGEYFKEVEEEVVYFLSTVSPEKRNNVILAYEPIWAIGKSGSGAATSHDLHEMALYIRKVLIEKFGRRLADTLPLIYGGSVDATNAESLMQTGVVNGFLPGRASLDVIQIEEIMSVVEKSYAPIQNS